MLEVFTEVSYVLSSTIFNLINLVYILIGYNLVYYIIS